MPGETVVTEGQLRLEPGSRVTEPPDLPLGAGAGAGGAAAAGRADTGLPTGATRRGRVLVEPF